MDWWSALLAIARRMAGTQSPHLSLQRFMAKTATTLPAPLSMQSAIRSAEMSWHSQ
jgi:hypothetical protein